MKFTIPGKDVLVINENDFNNQERQISNRVHLLKFAFKDPTEEKIKLTLDRYPETNRFIVEDNIKFYNYALKPYQKKYYIMNSMGTSLVSFFRKNNKILLSLVNLTQKERDFILSDLSDVLWNVEVVIGEKQIYHDYKDIFDNWWGNFIQFDKNYPI